MGGVERGCSDEALRSAKDARRYMEREDAILNFAILDRNLDWGRYRDFLDFAILRLTSWTSLY
jgi:hypothetical protein